MEICHILKADTYINAIGGETLYNKDEFKKRNIDLFFLKTEAILYQQFKSPFVPNLSIIDVIMHNSVGEVKEILNKYKLI